jgi:hypothetical protein
MICYSNKGWLPLAMDISMATRCCSARDMLITGTKTVINDLKTDFLKGMGYSKLSLNLFWEVSRRELLGNHSICYL